MTKILVIEDDISIRQNIVDILVSVGYDAFEAENGQIGVEMARKLVPDLILCDIFMPLLNGYGVLTALRLDPLTMNIPFIFLTAMVSADDVRKGMGLGADDYLTKPFKVEDLLAAIESRLERYKNYIKQIKDLRRDLSLLLPHELRTPLTVIVGFSQIIAGGEMLENRNEVMDMGKAIYDSAKRLEKLIENNLLYSQLLILETDRSQKSILNKKEMLMIKDCIETFAQKIAERYNRLSDLQLCITNLQVQIAEVNFSRIIEELLDNAFKFSNTNSMVNVTCQNSNNQLLLSISDQGRGMTADQISSIGAYRQFNREIYEQQGSGLGLVIAKLLTEVNDGKLSITSEIDKGTTIQLTFPKAN